MEIGNAFNMELPKASGKNKLQMEEKRKTAFAYIYNETLSHASIPQPYLNHGIALTMNSSTEMDKAMDMAGKQKILSCRNQEKRYMNIKGENGLKKYKDDQLLSNPGGDYYYLDQNDGIRKIEDHKSFWKRVGKDISDSFDNIKNLFGDLFFGSRVHYRDKENNIKEAWRRGIAGSVVDFLKDIGSAFSFGMWRPDCEEEPEGIMKRCGFFFTKMKEAFFGDLVQGVGGSAVHIVEDLLFTGWNLIETIPDATIGNSEIGRKITTSIFDNGQVVLDYLTDILPSGDAWVRVHSMKLKDFKPPFLNNISTPEYNNDDSRWKYVRNTTFRKSIETIGSSIVDIITLGLFGNLRFFSEERHNRN